MILPSSSSFSKMLLSKIRPYKYQLVLSFAAAISTETPNGNPKTPESNPKTPATPNGKQKTPTSDSNPKTTPTPNGNPQTPTSERTPETPNVSPTGGMSSRYQKASKWYDEYILTPRNEKTLTMVSQYVFLVGTGIVGFYYWVKTGLQKIGEGEEKDYTTNPVAAAALEDFLASKTYRIMSGQGEDDTMSQAGKKGEANSSTAILQVEEKVEEKEQATKPKEEVGKNKNNDPQVDGKREAISEEGKRGDNIADGKSGGNNADGKSGGSAADGKSNSTEKGKEDGTDGKNGGKAADGKSNSTEKKKEDGKAGKATTAKG